MRGMFNHFNNLVLREERRFGRVGWIIILSLILMIAAGIYVRPGTNYVGHGTAFEALCKNPLDLRNGNGLGYRIMTPLICWSIGLRGREFIIINLLFAAITIALTYQYFRNRATESGDALFAAICVTFSSVILVTIYYAGFCDALTWLAIFLAWRWRARWYLFYPLFAIGVLNHEIVFFLAPWLIFLKIAESNRRWLTVCELAIGFGVMIPTYLLFRHWLAGGTTTGLNMAAYLKPLLDDPLRSMRQPFQFYWLGFFSAFKAFWIFVFVALVAMWRNKEKMPAFKLALLLACSCLPLTVAFDSTRMLTLGFLALIIALEYLFRTNAYEFRRWAFWVLAFNFFIPQLFTAARVIEIMHSTPSNFLRMLLQDTPWWVAGG